MEKERPSWISLAEAMASYGYVLPQRVPHIRMSNAYGNLCSCYSELLASKDPELKFLETPELREIANWLTDNHHRGLLLYGTCGRGKTFFAKFVFPLLLYSYYGKIASYYDMPYACRHTDEVLHKKFLVLDDVGTEQKYNDFGTIRHTLDEVVDCAEKEGNLLILTSNLTRDELIKNYGERVYDRICALTTRILLEGDSFRQK